MLIWITLFFVTACSLEQDAGRTIRAHTTKNGGVMHAEPSINGARYCKHCHGTDLLGGNQGQPSCFQCHGRKWNDANSTVSLAPSDHNVSNGDEGFRHHPDLKSSTATCQTCHGSALQGTGKDGRASCFLCHAQLWN